jgi:arsenate reductase (glutaredoxin)
MMIVETLYWLPHCSTCQKAEAYLLERGVVIKNYIDIKTEALSAETVLKLAQGVGGPEALFSKRAMKFRAWGLHEKDLSEQDMLGYMVQEYTFMKRPIIVTDFGKTLCGFSSKQYQDLVTNA